MAGLFSRLKEGLTKTRQGLVNKISDVVRGYHNLDDEFYQDLEDVLIQADVGVNTSVELVEQLRRRAKEEKASTPGEVQVLLQDEIARIMSRESVPLNMAPGETTVIMVVGVNGVGKTTTIGKLAERFKGEGKKVMLAAGDTFRAAAIEQLEVWAHRAGVPLIKQQEGSDPAAVAYDAIQAARARKIDVVILDTAGRLQNKTNLMEELKKIRRVIEREMPGAPHEVLLVLDATTGQNALSQAKLFAEVAGVTSMALTKLDGTAKGGIVIAITREMDIPVKLIGIGERIEDLRDFEPREFVRALFDTQ
ncbi:MAG: signal recognition particle-docking protein FtsY [Bacillota bacterium]